MTPNIKAEIKDERLCITVENEGQSKGVDIRLPCDSRSLEAACCVLMINWAGFAEAELYAAGALALAGIEKEPMEQNA